MSDYEDHFDRLDALAAAWLDDTANTTEAAELDTVLRKSPTARRRVRDLLLLENALCEQLGLEDCAMPLDAPDTGGQKLRLAGRYALAASLLCACVLGIWHFGIAPMLASGTNGEATAPAGCAVLMATHDVDTAELPNALPGERLDAGLLTFSTGQIRLAFLSGVTMTVSGPASLELLSPTEARLVHGSVRARVAPAGRGFVLHTPGQRLVDIGTEFGVSVGAKDGGAELYVFEGEVELLNESAPAEPRRRVATGEGLAWSRTEQPTPSAPELSRFPELSTDLGSQEPGGVDRPALWRSQLRRRADDPRLLALFRFRPETGKIVPNLADLAAPDAYGLVVGAQTTSGRCGPENALEFKRPGDRVRVLLRGEHRALTFACWVRIDSLDRLYNGLYLTDHYERTGEPHWQIHQDGSLMFSIRGESATGAVANTIMHSRPFFTIDKAGQWFHLAVSLDLTSRTAQQYVNGELVGEGQIPVDVVVDAVRYGPGEFGNWGIPSGRVNWPVRNLNGRIDEFAIYRAALPEGEIAALHEEGARLK